MKTFIKNLFWVAISDSERASRWRRIIFAAHLFGALAGFTILLALHYVGIGAESVNQTFSLIALIGAVAIYGTGGMRLLLSDAGNGIRKY